MRGLPIVDRELREAARRPVTWRIRLALALSAVVSWMGFMVVFFSMGTSNSLQGRIVFSMLCGLLGWYALMAGPTLAADAVSREKRDGTLGFLFLTDLKPSDIILGKLAGRGLGAFYGLLGVLPVLGMTVLIGGVAGTMIWKTALALYDILFFSMAVSLWVSSVSRVERKALMTTILICIAAVLAPMGVAFYLDQVRNVTLTPALGAAIALPSLATPLILALEPPIPAPRALLDQTYALSILLHQLVGWFALWQAGRILKRSWQDHKSRRLFRRWRDWINWWRFGSSSQRKYHRQRWLQRNPFAWLALRELRKPLLVWIYLTGVFLGLSWGYWKSGPSVLTPDVLGPWTMILVGLMKIWVATESIRNLGEERQGGSIELLITTPLTVKEITRGQWQALRRQFLWPFLVVAFLLILSLTSVREELGRLPNEWLWLVTMYLVTLVADLWALGWTGMWQGLTSPTTNRAITQTVLLVLFAPWICFYLGLATISVINWVFSWQSFLGGVARMFLAEPIDFSGRTTLALWCVWNLIWAVGCGGMARWALQRDFREIASLPNPIGRFRAALASALDRRKAAQPRLSSQEASAATQ